MTNPFKRKPKPSAGRTATAASTNYSGGTYIQSPLMYGNSSGNYGMYGTSPTFYAYTQGYIGSPDYSAKGEVQNGLVAAFCAGIKHALDQLCPNADPAEREKMLVEAVAFRVASCNSKLTGKYALCIDTNGAIKLEDLEGEPDFLHAQGTWVRDPNQDDKRPFVIYRPVPQYFLGQNPYQNQWGSVTISSSSASSSLQSILGLGNLLP